MTRSRSNKSKLIYYKHELLQVLTKIMTAKYQCTILTSALLLRFLLRFSSPVINSSFKFFFKLKLKHTCNRTIRVTENFIMLRRCLLFFPPSLLLLMSLKCIGVCCLYILSEEEREVIDVIFLTNGSHTYVSGGVFFVKRQRLDNNIILRRSYLFTFVVTKH